MLHSIANKEGSISYDKAIIEQIINRAVDRQDGKIMLVNYRGGVSDLLIKIGASSAIIPDKDIQMRPGGLFIKLYVIVRIGESIRKSSGRLMNAIAADITGLLEIPLDNIEIEITGTFSKNMHIAKRQIVLIYRDMLNSELSTHDM